MLGFFGGIYVIKKKGEREVCHYMVMTLVFFFFSLLFFSSVLDVLSDVMDNAANNRESQLHQEWQQIQVKKKVRRMCFVVYKSLFPNIQYGYNKAKRRQVDSLRIEIQKLEQKRNILLQKNDEMKVNATINDFNFFFV